MPEDAPNSSMQMNGASAASLMAFFGIRKSVKSTNQKTNPVSYWSVAKGPITAFAFSPDREHLAVVSEDQCLRVVNFLKEKSVTVRRWWTRTRMNADTPLLGCSTCTTATTEG
jgi:hypothetical protein